MALKYDTTIPDRMGGERVHKIFNARLCVALFGRFVRLNIENAAPALRQDTSTEP
jgi:hypothetical protein